MTIDPRVAEAAKIATAWWTDLLQDGDKERFSKALTDIIVRELLRRESYQELEITCDYHPVGYLLEAVLEANPGLEPHEAMRINPARFPRKHSTYISRDAVLFKAGYGADLTETPVILPEGTSV